MNSKNLVSFRRRQLSYLIAAVCAGVTAGSATAQTDAGAVIEEVVVTGSRVTRADNATSSQPLTVISAEELSNSSTVDIGEVLRTNPALLASVTSTSSIGSQAANVGRANNVGGSALNLRGLGYQRTLTLVNGRRHVSGIEGTSSVDVSTIPSALIERVEVLTGGASAVYGADAVTGVVNFVLKNDFEGVEVDFRPGISEEGDAETSSLRTYFGRNFAEGRGNISVGVQHDYSAGLRAGDRDFLANGNRAGADVNPALRFQNGDITAANMPNFSQFYNYANTKQFPVGLRIPSASAFATSYTKAFGAAPSLTSAELALIDRAATATPRAFLPGRTFNVTSPYGVVVLGDFGRQTPLGSEPDLDGNGVTDCLQSFTGYNSSLNGASSFGAAGGCWYINEAGTLIPYADGLVAGNFNQFGAEQSYIAPNRPYVIPESEKYAINLNARYELTDSMEVFVESKYVYDEVEFGGGGHQATDYLYGAPDNPFLPAALAPFANNNGVSFVGPGGLYTSRDSDDWGKGLSLNERTTYRVVAGLKGSLDSLGLDYEFSANYGKFERSLAEEQSVITDRFFAAIDVVTNPATGQPVCRSTLNPTAYPQSTPFNFPAYVGGRVKSSFFTFNPGDGQCQPANIWGGKGAISQEAVDFFTYDRMVEEEIEQLVVGGFISGDSDMLFSLPAGPIAFAVGGEWREEKSAQSFDKYDQGILQVGGVTSQGKAFAAGQWVGDVSAAKSLGRAPGSRLLNTSASYDVWDAFAEVQIPVLAGMRFTEELTLDAAVRLADYSTFGSTTTYKVGGVWAPVTDYRLRANYSVANRVPNLFELFSPEQGQNFRPADPCDVSQLKSAPDPALRQANCVAYLTGKNVAQSNIFDASGAYKFVDPLSAGFPGVVGGNPNLLPEEATTKTVGIVMQPRQIDRLTISVDYWDIVIDDAISEISSQNIVNSCFDAASINNPFCDLIDRNSVTTSAQSGGFTFLRQTQLNFGQAQATGVDVNINYGFDIGNYLIRVGGAVTKQLTLEFTEPARTGEVAKVDYTLGETRKPEWAGQLTLGVATGPLSINWKTQYLSEQTLGNAPIETVIKNYGTAGITDEFFSHDISGSYEYSDTIRLYGGIGNVTNEKPFITERSYPVSPVGRSYYLGVNIML